MELESCIAYRAIFWLCIEFTSRFFSSVLETTHNYVVKAKKQYGNMFWLEWFNVSTMLVESFSILSPGSRHIICFIQTIGEESDLCFRLLDEYHSYVCVYLYLHFPKKLTA